MLHNLNHDTAILLFTRTGPAEAASKQLLPRRLAYQNRKLAGWLVREAVAKAGGCGFPHYIYTEAEQTGDTFGEKLAGAFEALFQKGYQHVIAIGNDCLLLTPAHIRDAAESLQSYACVLTPTPKGGLSLIGLNRDAYCRTSFEGIRWQTSFVLADFTSWMERSQNDLLQLPPLADISGPQELREQLLTLHPCNPFRIRVCSLLASMQSGNTRIISTVPPQGMSRSLPLRAPPFSR